MININCQQYNEFVSLNLIRELKEIVMVFTSLIRGSFGHSVLDSVLVQKQGGRVLTRRHVLVV